MEAVLVLDRSGAPKPPLFPNLRNPSSSRSYREERTMERRERAIQFVEVLLILGLLLICPQRVSALSVTVNDVECVYEYVVYDGDTISGNFVVVDHDLFWSSDHPGIDLVVSDSNPLILRLFLPRFSFF